MNAQLQEDNIVGSTNPEMIDTRPEIVQRPELALNQTDAERDFIFTKDNYIQVYGEAKWVTECCKFVVSLKLDV